MPASKASDKTDGSAKPRKVIDVTEPGKSAPPATSRPIIVSNRPILRQDPMMLTADGMEKADDKPQTALPRAATSKAIKIMPLSPVTDASSKQETAAEPTPKPAGTPARDEKAIALEVGTEAVQAVDKQADEKEIATAPNTAGQAAEKDAEQKDTDDMKLDAPDEPASPETKSEEAAASAAPIPAVQTSVPDDEKDLDDDSDGQLAPNQSLDQAKRKEEDAKLTRLAEEEKIIASKQFYLPISSVEKQRRSLDRVILAFVFVILLALVWLDIVLDAGIIKLGNIQPLTHFFQP